jgi:hypothetical protein
MIKVLTSRSTGFIAEVHVMLVVAENILVSAALWVLKDGIFVPSLSILENLIEFDSLYVL